MQYAGQFSIADKLIPLFTIIHISFVIREQLYLCVLHMVHVAVVFDLSVGAVRNDALMSTVKLQL